MKTTIAIYDPKPAVLDTVSDLLGKFGYDVTFKAETEAALMGWIGEFNFADVFVIDVSPYDMIGFDISKWIKYKFPGAKTILYSFDLDERVYYRFTNSDVADYYIHKVTGIDLLKRVIEFCTRELIQVFPKESKFSP